MTASDVSSNLSGLREKGRVFCRGRVSAPASAQNVPGTIQMVHVQKEKEESLSRSQHSCCPETHGGRDPGGLRQQKEQDIN